MDILSHALWGYVILYNTPLRWWGLLIGIIPDILNTITSIYWTLKSKKLKQNIKEFLKGSYTKLYSEQPKYIHTLDMISHSIFLFIIVATLSWILNINWLYLFPWMVHLLLDFFTHRDDYLKTLFFFPFKWSYNGIPWNNKYVQIINWGGLLVVFLIQVL